MRSVKWAAHVCAAAMLLLAAGAPASAQTATFSAIRDAVPVKYFESATTAPSSTDPNRLVIGLDSGFDFKTFTSNDFTVSALPFSNRTAADTISFLVTAPDGYYVSKITYTQRGVALT